MYKINSNTKTELSFNILSQDGANLTFIFKVDNQKLVKLGDGTYSIVFECEAASKKGSAYAVKLFYMPEQGIKLAEERFKDEIEASNLIREKLDPTKKDSSQIKYFNVIEILGGTVEFKQSNAYAHFKDLFDSLYISDYAVVTEKYEKTLKQVLENRHTHFTIRYKEFEPPIKKIPFCQTRNELETFIDRYRPDDKSILTKEEKESLKGRIYQDHFTGYDILRAMNFETRIRTILPFVTDVAKGLRTLHEASFLHLDIKPANIFVRDTFDSFQSAIGDLGFLKPQDYKLFEIPPLVPGASSSFPLGTRHYRSPEQKDYFDITDAQLLVNDGKVSLLIEDPKFLDTIIQPGDFAYFSKATAAAKIEHIKFAKADSKTTELRLSVPEESLSKLESDPKTQVVFYKRQQVKTDLFGFGAIIFDLLTCGKSPERFYELIKSFDRPEISIEYIIDKYDQVTSFRLGDANFSELFSPFRLNKNSSSYAPKNIVELILRCMLYKTSGIFSGPSEQNMENPHNIMPFILERINELQEQYHPVIVNQDENFLYAARLPSSEEIISSSERSFEKDIDSIRAISKERYIVRMVKGIKTFNKLVDLVSTVLDGKSKTFFAELNPRNIQVLDENNIDYEFESKTYQNALNYQSDIREDILYTRISSDLTDPYTPHYFAFIRRRLWLKRNPKIRNGKTKKDGRVLDWSYRFDDFSLYGDRIKIGDWIVYTGQDRNKLYKICDINKETKTVNLVEVEDAGKAESLQRFTQGGDDFSISKSLNGDDIPRGVHARIIFYEDINPKAYCFHMLSSYLFQLFFVGIDDNRTDNLFSNLLISLTSDQVAADISILGLDDTSSRWRKFSSRKSQKDIFMLAIDSLIEIYLKLTLSSSPQSYLGSTNNSEAKSMSFLKADIRTMEDIIAKLVNPRYENWQFMANLSDQELESEVKDLSILIGNKAKEDICFYRLISSRIKLHTSQEGMFLNLLLK